MVKNKIKENKNKKIVIKQNPEYYFGGSFPSPSPSFQFNVSKAEVTEKIYEKHF